MTIEVTQEDRELLAWLMNGVVDRRTLTGIRNSTKADRTEAMQKIARHRRAAYEKGQADAGPQGKE